MPPKNIYLFEKNSPSIYNESLSLLFFLFLFLVKPLKDGIIEGSHGNGESLKYSLSRHCSAVDLRLKSKKIDESTL
jgi:hypothetical protein